MAGKLSKLWCLNCSGFKHASGGILVRRLAGNGDNNKYFYMVHYDPTKKSKKRSCYLGYNGLTYVIIDDERYYRIYKSVIEGIIVGVYKDLDEDKRQEIWDVLVNLLIDMGWPRRFVFHKLVADLEDVRLKEQLHVLRNKLKKSAFLEKSRLRLDYSKYDDILDKRLSKTFRSDSFKQMKLKLKQN